MQFRQLSIGGTRYVDVDGELCLRGAGADGDTASAQPPQPLEQIDVCLALHSAHPNDPFRYQYQ